jgi:hypothetical protein
MEQMFPLDAAKHPETLRRHTLKAGIRRRRESR